MASKANGSNKLMYGGNGVNGGGKRMAGNQWQLMAISYNGNNIIWLHPANGVS